MYLSLPYTVLYAALYSLVVSNSSDKYAAQTKYGQCHFSYVFTTVFFKGFL